MWQHFSADNTDHVSSELCASLTDRALQNKKSCLAHVRPCVSLAFWAVLIAAVQLCAARVYVLTVVLVVCVSSTGLTVCDGVCTITSGCFCSVLQPCLFFMDATEVISISQFPKLCSKNKNAVEGAFLINNGGLNCGFHYPMCEKERTERDSIQGGAVTLRSITFYFSSFSKV